jgi:hypothetical protein
MPDQVLVFLMAGGIRWQQDIAGHPGYLIDYADHVPRPAFRSGGGACGISATTRALQCIPLYPRLVDDLACAG